MKKIMNFVLHIMNFFISIVFSKQKSSAKIQWKCCYIIRITNHQPRLNYYLIWSRLAYSHFAYSRFAYSHFAYSRFAYSGLSMNSRFAYSALFVSKHFFSYFFLFRSFLLSFICVLRVCSEYVCKFVNIVPLF